MAFFMNVYFIKRILSLLKDKSLEDQNIVIGSYDNFSYPPCSARRKKTLILELLLQLLSVSVERKISNIFEIKILKPPNLNKMLYIQEAIKANK